MVRSIGFSELASLVAVCLYSLVLASLNCQTSAENHAIDVSHSKNNITGQLTQEVISNGTQTVRDLYDATLDGCERVLNFTADLRNCGDRVEVIKALKHEIKESSEKPVLQFLMAIECLQKTVLNQVSERCKQVEESARIQYSDLQNLIVKFTKSDMVEFFKTGKISDFSISTIDDIHAYTNSNDITRKLMEEAVDEVYPSTNLTSLLQAIRNLSYPEHQLVAYRVVYETLTKSTSINHNDQLLQLAYEVRSVIWSDIYDDLSDRDTNDIKGPDNLKDLLKSFPVTIKNIVFSKKVCILNLKYNKFLEANVQDPTYDVNRREVSLRSTDAYVEGTREWILERYHGDYNRYYIKHATTGEYLFASVLDFDQDRRMLFTWINRRQLPSGVFYIEADGDCAYIRSEVYNEFLFTNKRNEVYTWKPGGKVAYVKLKRGESIVNVTRSPGAPVWCIYNCS